MTRRPLEPMDKPLAKRIQQSLRRLEMNIDAVGCTPTRHELSEHIAAMHRIVLKNIGETK